MNLEHLERHQLELLARMVEAIRSTPPATRVSFQYYELADSRTILDHPQFKQELVPYADVSVLERVGLLSLRRMSREGGKLDVTPEGFRIYEEWRKARGKPLEQLEEQVVSYVNSEAFKSTYRIAHDRWLAAADLLWKGDTSAQLSVIGHLCREAMQEFAAALPAVNSAVTNKTQTVARVRSAIESVQSSSHRAFLDALLSYWGTVTDLVQKQEHGGQREGESTTWEDARRVVFHTAVVMFEITVALGRGRAT